MYIGLWALEDPSCDAQICVYSGVVDLLPFASLTSLLAGLVPCNMVPTLVKHSCVLVYSSMRGKQLSCLPPLVLLVGKQEVGNEIFFWPSRETRTDLIVVVVNVCK